MTIHDLFTLRARGEGGAAHADMIPHMRELHELAQECDHCTEFGVRTGQSTIALLAGMATGGGGKLVSYDLNPPAFERPALPDGVSWQFNQGSTAELTAIEPTSLLMIDTLHNSQQVEAELKHAANVTDFVVFHDVVMFGWQPESYGYGILKAIFEWMAQHPEWRVHNFSFSAWGLLVLARR